MCNESPDYDKVSSLTWHNDDFKLSNLELSKIFFDTDENELPTPKRFDVYALVSGLSFSKDLVSRIMEVQRGISEVIPHNKYYWVKPNNLAIEYVVFKWPEEEWTDEKHSVILEKFNEFDFYGVEVCFKGFQINADGCVVIKGYDEKGDFLKIRRFFKENIPFLSSKQSNWFHIPIGRILHPVGKEAFKNLKRFVRHGSSLIDVKESLNSIHYLHEKKWYMEERTFIDSRVIE